FQAIVDRIYKILTNPHLDELEALEPKPVAATPSQEPRYPLLPHVRIGSIAGLLELLENRKEDLYRIAQELQLELDDILPIVQAAQLMELVELKEGDIGVTPIGHAFIQGDIDQRKLIIRQQLLKSIRLVQQIHTFLTAKQNHRIPESLVLDILERHFTPQEADRQLNTAIDWGRYAELFSYDEPAKEIFLESNDQEESFPLQTTAV
ncbi:AAA-associated domain-containing protein, partial [Parathermosynechococcus lividus]